MSEWTQDQIQTIQDILALYPVVRYQEALQAISKKLGRTVTKDVLSGLFRRRGLDAPTLYCRENDFLDEIEKALEKKHADSPKSVTHSPKVAAPQLSKSGDYERILIIPDTHVPYHDREAWALMLRAARVLQPDHVVHLGDLADFYAVSFHSKDPSRRHNLKEEAHHVKVALDQIGEACPHAKKTITKGNHEYRLERYIAEKAPELHGLVETDELLGFRERGWNVVQYRDTHRIGHMSFTHEEGNSGPLAHIKAGATFEGSVVIGHTHAMGMQFWRNAHGTAHVSASFGWLGDFKSVDYMHRVKAQRWQLGFGIGLVETNGNVLLQACPIVDGRVQILGQMIR